MKGRNTVLSILYIATLAAMDGSDARRRTTVAAAVALTLAGLVAAPGALAQSAGDEQYRDPLAGERPQQSPTPSAGAGGNDPATEQAPAAPSAPPVESAPSTPEAAAPTPAPTTTADGALPRTGAEPAWIAPAGLLVLAGGMLLRRRCA